MQAPLIIAPSILSADLARLGEDVTKVLEAGADWIHFDVMDNHYVPNLTFGSAVCQSLRNYGIKAPIDVHLMTENVDSYIERFAKAGANSISFHLEATEHPEKTLQKIQSLGLKAGLAFNPETSLDCLPFLLPKLDFVLIMSVNPGFGGQSFIFSTLNKIKQAKSLIKKSSLDIKIEVDGGVCLDNIQAVAEAGADIFVAGSAIFKSDDYKSTIDKMRQQIR